MQTLSASAASPSEWPVTRPLFFLLSFWVLAYAGGIDRSYLSDQENYVTNFVDGPMLLWLRGPTEGQSLLQFLVTQAVSEEILWRVWTTAVGVLLDPYTAVQFTVYVLNFLLIVSVWRTNSPEFALLLWILVPVGFVVIGLMQIRQGFGFAVMMVLALGARRPAQGAAIAAMIHTTFAVAFVFTFIGWLFRSRERIALTITVVTAFLGAYLGGLLFEMFGGRRLVTYAPSEGATSINYVLGGILSILPSLFWIFRDRAAEGDARAATSITQLALAHIGVTAFTLFSFFIFPLGAGRVGYLTQLLLIPILPAVARQRGAVPKAIVSLLLLYLLYLVIKSYLEGTYALYFGP